MRGSCTRSPHCRGHEPHERFVASALRCCARIRGRRRMRRRPSPTFGRQCRRRRPSLSESAKRFHSAGASPVTAGMEALCHASIGYRPDLPLMDDLLPHTLAQVLARRNGFWSFEGALHVLPHIAGPNGIAAWNATDGWRSLFTVEKELTFFARDAFGFPIGMDARTQAILSLDYETGDVAEVAGSLEAWAARVLADPAVEVGSTVWRNVAACRSLRTDQWDVCLGPKHPFVLGGEFGEGNVEPTPLDVVLRRGAGLAQALRSTPDGATVRVTTGPC